MILTIMMKDIDRLKKTLSNISLSKYDFCQTLLVLRFIRTMIQVRGCVANSAVKLARLTGWDLIASRSFPAMRAGPTSRDSNLYYSSATFQQLYDIGGPCMK